MIQQRGLRSGQWKKKKKENTVTSTYHIKKETCTERHKVLSEAKRY